MRLLALMSFFLFISTNNQTNTDVEKSLQVHNSARLEVGVSDLMWSKELEKDAKNYAEILAYKDSGLQHSKFRNDQGENLASFFESSTKNGVESFIFSKTPLTDASIAWYEEIKDYRYSKVKGSSSGPVVRHYTQMVWKNTTHVGIASAISKTGKVYVVARYYPAGNYIGEYPY